VFVTLRRPRPRPHIAPQQSGERLARDYLIVSYLIVDEGRKLRRREFIALFGGAAAWPSAARAQQPGIPVVGFLHYGSPGTYVHILSAFRQGLRDAGFVEGQNVAIQQRWANGQYDRLPALAADLVDHKVVAIAAAGFVGAQAAKAATAIIPIVFGSGVDPVAAGIVPSLNRPGGNLTGVSLIAQELTAKRVELLHELMPQARVVALLVNPDNPASGTELADAEAAARTLGFQIRKMTASNERDLDATFATMETPRVDALIVGQDAYHLHRRDQIVVLAARHAVPAVYAWREYPAAGGLISYATSLADGYRQVGVYIGKILKGAKPGDLPVEQPTKFELVINLKTAKALGITIPPTFLARADEVIE
jgi:putative tryptophan/tyrosine transport system substrate-binding protein